MKKITILFLLMSLGTGAFAVGWYQDTTNPNLAWRFRQKITINTAQVSGELTDFPVFVRITDTANPVFSNAQTTGRDILFTSSDAVSKITHEVETYNSSTSTLCAWVRTPVSATTAVVLYMYYGCATAGTQESKSGVWDSNYIGVWHLSDASTAVAKDSTTNVCTMAGYGDLAVPGILSNGVSLGGVSTSIITMELPGKEPLFDVAAGVSLTFSLWIKVTTFETGWQPIFTKSNGSWRLSRNNATTTCCFALNGPGTTNLAGLVGVQDSQWHYMVCVFDNANNVEYMYNNGVLDTTEAAANDVTNVTQPVNIGANSGAAGNGYFHGYVDEARFSTTARSAQWVKSEYNNQSNPGAFCTISPQERRPSVMIINKPPPAENKRKLAEAGIMREH